MEVAKLMLELEVTVVKVDRKETESYSIQSYGTYTENWERVRATESRDEDTMAKRLSLLCLFKDSCKVTKDKTVFWAWCERD